MRDRQAGRQAGRERGRNDGGKNDDDVGGKNGCMDEM